jgi:hypothetical protein
LCWVVHNLANDYAILAWGIKLVLVFFLWATYRNVRRRSFIEGDTPFALAINGMIPLTFLIIITPSFVWTYHLVWLIMPALLIVSKLNTRRQAMLFAMAYAMVFLLPEFPLYLCSALRIAGWMTFYGMMAAAVWQNWKGNWVNSLFVTPYSSSERYRSLPQFPGHDGVFFVTSFETSVTEHVADLVE